MESCAELYQVRLYISDNAEKRETWDLCSIGNQSKTVHLPRVEITDRVYYACTIFYGAPTPTFVADEPYCLLWEVARAVYNPNNPNKTVRYGSALELGPPTMVVPQGLVVEEGANSPTDKMVRVGVCKYSLLPSLCLRCHGN